MKPFRSISLLVVLLLSYVLAFSSIHDVHAQYVQKVLVKSGDTAPGTNGAIFNSTSWNPPISIGISFAGDVFFKATLEDGVGDATPENIDGLWVYEPRIDAVRLVFRAGEEVPGMTGVVFTEVNEERTSIDLTGQIGLDAYYSVSGDIQHGFFMEARGTSGNGTLLRKVYDGMELLPAMPGVTLSDFGPIAFNNGRLLFIGQIEGPGVDLNRNDAVLCIYEPTGITVIVRKTDPMPIVGNGYISTSISSNIEFVALDVSGGAVVQLKGQQFGEPDILAAYHWDRSSLFTALAISSQDPTGIVLGDSRMNTDGWIARRGYPQNLGYGFRTIWSGPAGQGAGNKIIAEQDIAEGTGGTIFTGLNDFVLFDNKQIAVNGFLSDGRSGIWIGDETGLQKIALTGDAPPGLDTSMRFTRVNNMMANRVGKVAFADVVDNGGFGIDGLWIGSRNGLESISLGDEQIDIDNITVRTIERHFAGHFLARSFWTRTGADGYSALLNDSGKIAYGVTFKEGGNALILGSPGGLVVNSNLDLPDNDTTDGRCFTGRLLPDGRPECTFRAAIKEANVQRGANMITFDIDGDTTIVPQTNLPAIIDSVFIDASTQPNGKIVLEGSGANVTNGVLLSGVGNTIKGLVIGGFPENGIFIRNGGENNIYGCVIGYTGSFGFGGGNDGDGINLRNTTDNRIGGPEPGQGNNISNNEQCGIALEAGSCNNKIFNNQVGLTRNLFNRANRDCGILIHNASDTNIIGGGPDSMNYISGNAGDGVAIVNSHANLIDGNIISYNLNGVSIETGSQENMLIRNRIGIHQDGLEDGNKSFGIQIVDGSESNYVGGDSDSRNYISANDSGGVLIHASNFNTVVGNYIGTNVDGTEAMGNRGHGIEINNSSSTVVGQRTFLGSVIGHGNLISGNDSGGVVVLDHSENTIITSNLIGVAEDSISSMGNMWGVIVHNSNHTLIGFDGFLIPDLGNIIQTNKSTGIMLLSDSCSIVSNSISYNGSPGTMRRGDGIHIDGHTNLIGLDGMENELFENYGTGVYIADDIDHSNDFNRVQYNRYYSNAKGGLDLAPLGIDPVDNLDLDDGPNDSQNAPRLVSVTYTHNDVLLIKGVLHSKANQQYHVIVYDNDDCFGGIDFPNEGFLAILEDTITTDAYGDALIDFSEGPWHPPIPIAITMNVTDMSGNTSEFSNCLYIWDQPIGVDLVATKSDNRDSVSVTDTLHYEITVTNAGSEPATNVVVSDSLPTLITYLSDSTDHGTCLYSNGRLTCNLGTLPPLDVATISLTTIVTSVGTIENNVLVTATEIDVNPASNVAIDTTISSDVHTDIGDGDRNNSLPDKFELSQNYPNPFNPTTTINYSLPVGSHVTLRIFNVLGQEIRSLIDRDQPAGYHTLVWDGLDRNGRQVSSGIYLYRLNAKDYTESKKMILMK